MNVMEWMASQPDAKSIQAKMHERKSDRAIPRTPEQMVELAHRLAELCDPIHGIRRMDAKAEMDLKENAFATVYTKAIELKLIRRVLRHKQTTLYRVRQ